MKRLIIIGGGASGVICAINAKRQAPDLDVTIIEQNDRILKKVLKTGNGKCNIANAHIEEGNYNDFHLIKDNIKHFDVKAFFASLGILIKEDTEGRMFPHSESAKSVVEILKNEVEKLKINLTCEQPVTNIYFQNDKWFVQASNNNYQGDYLVIATGTLAQEQTNGYHLLGTLKHHITPLKPALTFIKVREKVKHMQGIRVKATENNFHVKGELLFKEDALSGILSFELSRLIKDNDVLSFDLIAGFHDEALTILQERSNKEQLSPEIIYGLVPKMVAIDVYNRSDKTLQGIFHTLTDYRFNTRRNENFLECQIVQGGVVLDEVGDQFQSLLYNNLYIIGEILDVDGATGGYNLYFAWLSGIISSNDIIKRQQQLK